MLKIILKDLKSKNDTSITVGLIHKSYTVKDIEELIKLNEEYYGEKCVVILERV